MDSLHDDGPPDRRVSPFGNPRIYAPWQLPVAYRSLARPSSAPDTKVSTVSPYSLNLLNCSTFRYPLAFLYAIFKVQFPGGGKQIRTAGLLLARQALSQLSYTPTLLVGLSGFEPLTSRLSGVRSNQLSYRPIPEGTIPQN